MDWTGIVKTIGATGVVVIVLGYFLRQVFQQVLSRDIEKFKAALSAKHDMEIERLRNDLRITASEHETRFTRLHETRAEVIAELYKRLVHAHEAFDDFVCMTQVGGDPDPAKEKEAAERWTEFRDYFSEKRIFFGEELCCDIDAVFGQYFNTRTLTGLPIEMPGSIELRSKAATHFSGHFPPLRAKIEQQFRELLGVRPAQSKGQATSAK